MGYKALLSYSYTIDTSYCLPTYEKTRQKFLNLGSSIKTNMLHVFFSSYVLINERKESKTPNTSNLMLEARPLNSKRNSQVIIHINSKESFTLTSSLALELIIIVKLRPSNNN
jgi:hypothetical protein